MLRYTHIAWLIKYVTAKILLHRWKQMMIARCQIKAVSGVFKVLHLRNCTPFELIF
jgi:hypothetical protein